MLCMEYLRSLCAAVMPSRGVPAPGSPDLEACGGGLESVVIVTDAADVRVQVRPLPRASDIYDAVNRV